MNLSLAQKFIHTGNVPLSKGNMAWTTNVWNDEFKIEFDVIVKRRSFWPLGDIIFKILFR